jgi:hypothetical protein
VTNRQWLFMLLGIAVLVFVGAIAAVAFIAA